MNALTDHLAETEHNAFPNGRWSRPEGHPDASDSALHIPHSALEAGESARLQACEDIINRGLKTFVEVGTALGTIREQRLYRAEFATFDEYCSVRWGWRARQAQRVMAGAEIAKLLGSPGGQTLMLPASESQVRPLTSLPPEQQRAAWEEAVLSAGGDRVTAKHVQAVVDRFRGAASSPAVGTDSTPSQTSPSAAFEFRPAPDRPLASKEMKLREAATLAIDQVRRLQELMGAADSAAGAEIAVALDRLESFQEHLRHVEKLQASRASRLEHCVHAQNLRAT